MMVLWVGLNPHPYMKYERGINFIMKNDVINTNMITEPCYMKNMSYKYGKLQKIIYGFIETGFLCAKVVGINEYKNIHSAYGSYYSAIRRLEKVPVRVSVSKGELFLFRTDKELYHVDVLDVTKYC